MIRDLRRAQPGAPELDGLVQCGGCFLHGRRKGVFPPGKGDEGRFSGRDRSAPVTAGPQHAQRDSTGNTELQGSFGRGGPHGVVPVAAVGPRAARGAVIEERGAIHEHLDPAAGTGGQPEQNSGGPGISGRPMIIGPPLLARGRAHDQEVVNGQPSRRGLPRRLQHHRPRHVPAVLRHLGVGRAEPEGARGAISSAPKTLGESGRGRHSHSTAPSGATRQFCSQLDRKA